MNTFALARLILPAIIASAPGFGAITEEDDTEALLTREEAAMLVPVYHDVRLHLAIDGSWITVEDRAFIKACVGNLDGSSTVRFCNPLVLWTL